VPQLARRRPDPLDVALGDDELWAEVKLLGEVMVAASAARRRLHQGDIDRLLGLS
jgi:hypothetical protein